MSALGSLTFNDAFRDAPPPSLVDLDHYWRFMCGEALDVAGKTMTEPEFMDWFYATEDKYFEGAGRSVQALTNMLTSQDVRCLTILTAFTS